MDINEIPRGQLSTIILTTLLDGDKYGYEIIDEIEKKTFGEVIVKKPSLYSSLNRMEKQDLVSSYWKDSDIGGPRHYYRLTDYGKKQALQWQDELLSSQTKVSKILKNEVEQKTVVTQVKMPEEHKETILQQENLFSLTKSEEKKETIKEEKKFETNKEQEGKSDFIQYDLFQSNNFISYPEESSKKEKSSISNEPTVFNIKAFEPKEEKEEVIIEDIKPMIVQEEKQTQSLQETIAQTQNKTESELAKKLMQVKKSFNFENEYGKYLKSAQSYTQTLENAKEEKPKSTSFSFASNFETQNVFDKAPSFTQSLVENEFEEAIQEEPEKTSIYFKEQPKTEMGTSKSYQNYNPNVLEQEELQEIVEVQEQHISERKDDAVLITAKPDENQLPKVKKIAPATFHHGELKNINPEPKAKPKVDPNYYQTIDTSYQYEQEKTEVTDQTEYIKQYFASKNIEYSPYSKKLISKTLTPKPVQPYKSGSKNVFKINQYKLFSSFTLFSLILIESLAIIFSLVALNVFNMNTLWLYITVNAITLANFVINLVIYLKDKEKLVAKSILVQNPLWYKLVFVVLALILLYALHLLGGMTEFNYTNYLTTLILPASLLVDYIIFHFVFLFAMNKKVA